MLEDNIIGLNNETKASKRDQNSKGLHSQRQAVLEKAYNNR